MSNSNGWSAIFGIFGLKSRVVNLEKSVDSFKGSIRYVDTCNETHKAISKELKEIKDSQEKMQTEQGKIHTKIGVLLERTKKL